MTETQKLFNKTIKFYDDFPKPGVKFIDLIPVFQDRHLMKNIVHDIGQSLYNDLNSRFDLMRSPSGFKLMVADGRGLILGSLLSEELNMDMVLFRDAKKLPGDIIKVKFKNEYAEREFGIEQGSISKTDAVILVDDVIATGNTMVAMEDCYNKAVNGPLYTQMYDAPIGIVAKVCLVHLKYLNYKSKNIIAFNSRNK